MAIETAALGHIAEEVTRKVPSAQDTASELIKKGLSLEETVSELRDQGQVIAEFHIGGRLTYWTIGRMSFGEPVWHSLCDQYNFVKGQRMCWEYMYNTMDEVHR